MTTGLGALDKTVYKTIEWLKDVQEELKFDSRDDSYDAVRAVFHSLRDRLPVNEAVELGAQLPVILRGVYYEGWKPEGKPLKIDRQEFLDHVDREMNRERDRSMQRQDPLRITRGVFTVLEKRISGGELKDIKDNLPEDMLSLWAQQCR